MRASVCASVALSVCVCADCLICTQCRRKCLLISLFLVFSGIWQRDAEQEGKGGGGEKKERGKEEKKEVAHNDNRCPIDECVFFDGGGACLCVSAACRGRKNVFGRGRAHSGKLKGCSRPATISTALGGASMPS